MEKKILIFDSTLRDGSHANKHQFSQEQIQLYCKEMDGVGFDVVFVGHGNGLGASSSQIGFSKVDDITALKTAKKELKQTKLGAYMIPGFGTIKEQIIPAISAGVDIFEIGCHCTESDISNEHICFIKENRKVAYGTLMMFHMADIDILIKNAKKMESYGADGIILMDSAGAMMPQKIMEVFTALDNELSIPIGFHGHNNLGLAIANTLSSIEGGAQIIDGTLRGYGAGAGNCQLEIICTLLNNNIIPGKKCNFDELKLLKKSDKIMNKIMHKEMGISPLCIASGIAGVFSAFKEHAINAAETFKVSPIDILIETGKRKAVGGQEDIIVQIAQDLSKSEV